MLASLAEHSFVPACASSIVVHIVVRLPFAQAHAQSAQDADPRINKTLATNDFSSNCIADTYFNEPGGYSHPVESKTKVGKCEQKPERLSDFSLDQLTITSSLLTSSDNTNVQPDVIRDRVHTLEKNTLLG